MNGYPIQPQLLDRPPMPSSSNSHSLLRLHNRIAPVTALVALESQVIQFSHTTARIALLLPLIKTRIDDLHSPSITNIPHIEVPQFLSKLRCQLRREANSITKELMQLREDCSSSKLVDFHSRCRQVFYNFCAALDMVLEYLSRWRRCLDVDSIEIFTGSTTKWFACRSTDSWNFTSLMENNKDELSSYDSTSPCESQDNPSPTTKESDTDDLTSDSDIRQGLARDIEMIENLSVYLYSSFDFLPWSVQPRTNFKRSNVDDEPFEGQMIERKREKNRNKRWELPRKGCPRTVIIGLSVTFLIVVILTITLLVVLPR